MKRSRLAALVLALLPLAAGAGDAAPPPRPVVTVEKAPAGTRAKPRLAAWRQGARPPAEVPPTAIVRAAKRDGAAPGGRRRPARTEAKADPVEIVWDAQNSSR